MAKRSKQEPGYKPEDCYYPSPGEPGHEHGWFAHKEDGGYRVITGQKPLPRGFGPFKSVDPLVALRLSAECVEEHGFGEEKK